MIHRKNYSAHTLSQHLGIPLLLASLLVFFSSFSPALAESTAEGTIKIAVNLELSGPIFFVGKKIKRGVDLALTTLEKNGGLEIGGKKYRIETIEFDNKNDKTTASRMTLQAVQKDKVIAIIPPASSAMAAQVAQVADPLETPVVTANTSSPKVTRGRRYAFKTVANYKSMAQATLELARTEWKAKKAAIFYNRNIGYCVDVATAVKKSFTKTYGGDAVSAFVGFEDMETVKQQLADVLRSDADFLYLSCYGVNVMTVIKMAKEMGWDKPITGPDTWSFDELRKECGKSYCDGEYFTGNFVVKGAEGKMKEFIDLYKAQYNEEPDESAAAGYDAISVILEGLRQLDSLSGNIREDRKKLRNAIASVKFEGATAGVISYGSQVDNEGEPEKCVVTVKIDKGEFVKHSIVCPNSN